MKKVLSLLLAVMMVVSLCPITSLADEMKQLDFSQTVGMEEQQEELQPEQPAEEKPAQEPEQPAKEPAEQPKAAPASTEGDTGWVEGLTLSAVKDGVTYPMVINAEEKTVTIYGEGFEGTLSLADAAIVGKKNGEDWNGTAKFSDDAAVERVGSNYTVKGRVALTSVNDGEAELTLNIALFTEAGFFAKGYGISLNQGYSITDYIEYNQIAGKDKLVFYTYNAEGVKKRGEIKFYVFKNCTVTSDKGTVTLSGTSVNINIGTFLIGEKINVTIKNEIGDEKNIEFSLEQGYQVKGSLSVGGKVSIAREDGKQLAYPIAPGTVINLQADPEPGMVVEEWFVEGTNNDPKVTLVDGDPNRASFVTINENVTASAVFRPIKEGEADSGFRIKSVTVANGTATIDQSTSTVKIFLDKGSDITKVAPIIEIPEGATISPASGEEVNLSNTVTYTVSRNGGSHTYKFSASMNTMDKGRGTQDDPIRIENVDDLIMLRDTVNSGTTYEGKYIVQTVDLDLSQFGEAWEPIGTARKDLSSYAYVPNKPFMGIYDGQNHKILNMKCVFSENERAKGFFGAVRNATIKNLIIDESCYIKASMYVAGVAGLAVDSTFENCVNHADIYATSYATGLASDFRRSYAGGICGEAKTSNKNIGSMIIKCSNTGSIGCDVTASGWGYSGPNYTGGVAGSCPTLILCSNSGSIDGGSYTGGVVGSGTAIGCWNTGKVKSTYNSTIGDNLSQVHDGVGGVVGSGKAESCYNKGSVSSNWIAVGGIAGCGSVNNSYNLGEVSTSYSGEYQICKGQLLGYADKGSENMKNLFYATDSITGAVGYDWAIKDGAEGNPAREEMMLGSEMLEALMEYTSETLQKVEWMADLNGSNGGYPVLIDYSIKPSAEKKITSAKYGSRVGAIDEENGTISFVLSYGADISSIALSVAVNEGATVSPASGERVDFSKGPVTYTVTAADGSTRDYIVTITVASSSNGLAYLDVTYGYSNDKISLFKGVAFKQDKYEYTFDMQDTELMQGGNSGCAFAIYEIPAVREAVVTASINGDTPFTVDNKTDTSKTSIGTGRTYAKLLTIGKNTLTITVTNPGSTESVTYTIIVNVHPTIKKFVINDTSSSISPAFDPAVTEYVINIQDSTAELPVSYSTSFKNEYGRVKLTNPEGTIAYTKDFLNDAIYEGNVTITSEMNEFQITVAGAAEGAESKTYTFKLNRTGTYEVEFTSNVENAVIRVFDKDGNKLTPDENDKFIFTRGETYAYTAAARGYVSAAGTVTGVDQLTDGKFVISLEKVPGVKYPDLGAYWPTFRGNDENMAVTDVKTPKSESETSLLWANKAGIGYNSGAISSPIIVGGYIYAYAGSRIMKIDKQTGVTVAEADMVGSSSFSIVPPTYADGMIFVGLSRGRVQAFRADTLESLWVYKDELGGQPNSQIVYKDGCVYTGFWVSESKDANFVCIDASDEDPANPTEAKYALWTYTQAGGFYWAGAYATDKFIVVTTDDGKSGSNSTGSSIIVFDKDTGAKVSSIDNLYGDLRSNVAYDEASNRVYFTSKGGYLYSVAINWGTGEIDTSSFKSIALGGMSTSTPVAYKGRVYVGVSGSGQFSAYSGHNITVIDINTWTVAYRAYMKGYPQTSALVSGAYEGADGYTYVYFTENYTPGAIRYIKDKAGQTALVDGIMENGQLCAPILYTPGENLAQYCICSPIVDENGTLFFKNDTGYMMAVSVTAESLEIAQKPTSITENSDGTVTTEDMKVYAVLKNGEKVDVSKYVTVTADGDVSYKVTYTYGSEIAEGVKTLTASFADDNKAAAKAVDDLIAAIGKVEFTDASKAKIDAARAAYDKLTDAQKKLVKKLKILTDAEAEYQRLLDQHKADEVAAKAVDDMVNKLQPVTVNSGKAIEAARKAFDALTPEQKKLLDPKTEDKLVVAENEYKKLVKEDADKKAAKEVEDKIAALQPVTKDSGEAIKDARSSYEALTPEQKALVSKDSVAALDKAEKVYDMIIASTKPGTAVGDNTGSTSGSGVIKITANAAAKGEQNPHTGAPVMSMAPAVLVLAAAALVLKKHK